LTDSKPGEASVLYRVDAGIARITLNRPQKRNALSAELVAALAGAITNSAGDPAVRALLITGAGPDFCAGADLRELHESAGAGMPEHIATARSLADVYIAMRKHPRPIVAAVRGRALGGGCGVATACDMVLAGESAKLGYPEVNIGFIPAIVMTMLCRSVSEKRAFELLTKGTPVSAVEAHSIGLVNHVYPDTEFETRVEAFVLSLASLSASAVSLTKNLLYRTEGMGFEDAIDAGVQANALARMTEDARRGIAAFIKKN
jgi:methylglutaconyl-CoA hydratase